MKIQRRYLANPSIDIARSRLLANLLRKTVACGQATPSDGYILQIAVITFLVVIIGVAAYASRTTSGFFGAINQSVNREARDTAESAITEFQDALNRIENRYLLVKGGSSPAWSTSDSTLKNPCTSTTVSAQGVPDLRTALAPDAAVISRFSPVSSLDGANFKNLIAGDTARQFAIEKVEYIYDSDPLSGSSGRILPSTPGYAWPPASLLEGGTRTLLRVTVVARVTRNGVVSQSRIAREFEVVPKCCNRSYGNTYGGKNWGRDSGACTIIKSPGGANGLITIGGLTTGADGTSYRITDENGNPVTQAKCWAGNGGEPSTLVGGASTSCLNNQVVFTGSPGVSFTPSIFPLSIPLWANTSSVDQAAGLPAATPSAVASQQESTLTGNKNYYLYFNPLLKKLCVREVGSLAATSFSGSPSCTSGSFQTILGGGSTDDPCSYKDVSYIWDPANPGYTGNGVPYYEVSCRLRNIRTSNNTAIIIDTSNMKLNLHFDSSSYTGEYLGGGGNTIFVRRHCRKTSGQLSVAPVNLSSPCTVDTTVADYTTSGICPVLVNPGNSAQTLPCARAYNIAELFNIYATGTGTFALKGGGSTVGFNLVAPFSSVSFSGGGSADPNFMGRIIAKDISLNGNIKIRTLSGNPSFCDVGVPCPPTGGSPYFDFQARSFSHASGF